MSKFKKKEEQVGNSNSTFSLFLYFILFPAYYLYLKVLRTESRYQVPSSSSRRPAASTYLRTDGGKRKARSNAM